MTAVAFVAKVLEDQDDVTDAFLDRLVAYDVALAVLRFPKRLFNST